MSRLALLTWSKSGAWPPNYMALLDKGEVLGSPRQGARICSYAVCKSTYGDSKAENQWPSELSILCLRASECIKSERMCLCNPICSWKPCRGLHAADISCVNKNSIHSLKTASWSGLTGRLPKGGPFLRKSLDFGGSSDCLFGLPLIVLSLAW